MCKITGNMIRPSIVRVVNLYLCVSVSAHNFDGLLQLSEGHVDPLLAVLVVEDQLDVATVLHPVP